MIQGKLAKDMIQGELGMNHSVKLINHNGKDMKQSGIVVNQRKKYSSRQDHEKSQGRKSTVESAKPCEVCTCESRESQIQNDPPSLNYRNCRLCPKCCGVNREAGEPGACGMGAELRVARASLHMWEEPSLSGEHGSGTVFFSGCPLSCVYCQNHAISSGKLGEKLSAQDLVDVFLKLQALGAENINLVTACHFLPQVREALIAAKAKGLILPVVYNSSGYERVESLRELEGLIDIYLPDFRYWDNQLALRYSQAPHYVETTQDALAEMFRQVGPFILDQRGMMQKGMIVRQLLLPGQTEAAMAISHDLHKRYGDAIMLSLMSQYTPLHKNALRAFPELQKKVDPAEYERWVNFCVDEEIIHAYVQEGEAASESFIPDFTSWTLADFLGKN